MDDPRWLRLIMVGLVLAALAVGYFFLTGKFSAKNLKNTTTKTEVVQTTPAPNPAIVPVEDNPLPDLRQTSQTTPAAMAAARQRISTLPKTGYPQVLLGVITIGIMVSGLSLRKFPN